MADSGELIYVNAGHNPPYLYRASDDRPELLPRTNMVLGLDDTLQFDQRRVSLDVGDTLVMYTDGLTDALNTRGEEFGVERLQRVCAENRHRPAEQVVAALRDRLLAFVGDAPLADDCTVVVAKRV